MTFDYGLPAEVFTSNHKGGARQRLGYRRLTIVFHQQLLGSAGADSALSQSDRA